MISGLAPQVAETPVLIVMDEFLLQAGLKFVGLLDDTLNNEHYTYLALIEATATPWRQNNPLKPLGYKEGVVKIDEMFMVYPTDPAVQTKIQLRPVTRRTVLYAGPFVISGNLSMPPGTDLLDVMDTLTTRFVALTEASFFCTFPAKATMPEVMPVVLVNKAKVSHFHGYP